MTPAPEVAGSLVDTSVLSDAVQLESGRVSRSFGSFHPAALLLPGKVQILSDPVGS